MKIIAFITGLIGFFGLVYVVVISHLFTIYEPNFNIISTLSIGFLGTGFALWWNSKQNERQEKEYKGSLSLYVNPENISILVNNSKVPVKIRNTYFATKSYDRENATEDNILSKYDYLKVFSKKSLLCKNLTLSPSESIVLPIEQTGIIKPIEEYNLIVQVIKIEFSEINSKKLFTKFFSVYRLTSPFQKLVYDVGQKEEVNFRLIYSKLALRFYPEGLIVDYLKKLIKINDINDEVNIFNNMKIINNLSQIKSIEKAINKFETLEEMDNDKLPQDRWIPFRIEEI